MDYSSIEQYCQANQARFVEELTKLCSIPSVSTDPSHAADVRKSAAFVADELRRLNFDRVEIWETEGHPAVFASKQVSNDAPTVLVYGHHDVQPADPLDQWKTPPFEPTIRDGCLYARGAADDKGQVWMHMKAIETCLSDGSSLPINLKVIIEGEEEIGSTHFGDLLKAHREDLECDVACVSDSAFFEKGVPSLDTGLRGLVVLEATVTSANQDCHSGEFGGAVFNPIRVLAGIITSLHDANNRVTVPGFYDDVLEPTQAERAQVASLPFDVARFLSNAGGAMAEVGEAGWSSLERTWMRPTLEYNGITGGFQGEGSKTIIPARASVKITCRLVPNQDPDDIAKRVGDELRSRVPDGVKIEVSGHAHAYPVLTPMDHPAVVAAQNAIEKSFGKPTVVARMGGTIPPVALFQKELGVPTILAGFGLPDDRLHGPNEKFDLEQFFGGIRAMAYLWTQIPAVMPAKV